MEKKCEKYVVNMETPRNTLPLPSPTDQVLLRSACQLPASSDVIGDTTVDVAGTCTSPGCLDPHLGCSPCPKRDFCHGQVKPNCSSACFHWKIFLTCLLACVITVVIGVLIVCLVYKEENNSGPLIINISSNDWRPRESSSEPRLTTTTTKFTSATDTTTMITNILPPLTTLLLQPPAE